MNAPEHAELKPLATLAGTHISLNDKYTLPKGRVFLNGSQALVRLTLLQAQLDKKAGLNTGGFVSGYRGSPLGGVDQAFWAAKSHLRQANIQFQPGLNEDLGATAVWGSQQVNLFQGAQVDGVFGLWYGKGPGVDRSVDVLKHANAAGTSRHGGVLLVAGDDHAAKSSTLPHQSDHVLKACMIPVLFPATLQEYFDLGVLGYAMSRYAGVWVGFKAIADIVESSASVWVDPDRYTIALPTDFEMPPDGLNIRWPDSPLAQEARLLDMKLYAAMAFARANKINRTVYDSPNPRFGIVASGKAYCDTLQALNDLGLTEQACAELGIRLFKVGMVWPLDATGIREFATGLQEILVVEEKRQMIEYQIKEELYAWREDVRPRVYGKFDERAAEDGREGGEWSVPQGRWLLPAHYELDPARIARAIAARLSHFDLPPEIRHSFRSRLHTIAHREEVGHPTHAPIERKPYFCSGCPHNTSTKVPEGSRAMAGIGCHYMVVWMDRNTETFTQMGGEGVPWIGQAPFTQTKHVFANLGDGTYFHSGILAIRASVSAGVNITYKLLYNDAVAMTGGQHIDGTLTVPQLTRQLQAENVSRVVIVTDNPGQYNLLHESDPIAPDVNIYDRSQLDAVQRQLRDIAGTTVLIYEQTCASEKRRRRKRVDPQTGGPMYPDPPKRVMINPRVCEGCGDCSEHSNCLSIEPVKTVWGVKRTINQSTCNKDYSCLEGLCPSLVTVEGAELLKPAVSRVQHDLAGLLVDLPTPEFTLQPGKLDRRYASLVVGVGGTGVVTIGALLGMAAHIEGLEVNGLDMAGLAQKGGAVYSHLQIAPAGQTLAGAKIPVGEADLLLAGDLFVAAHPATLELLKDDAQVVIDADASPTADFIHNPDWYAPRQVLHDDLRQALNDPAARMVEVRAKDLARELLGDTVFANTLLLGLAWQKGWVPLHLESLMQAIALNGVQTEKNSLAFGLGRCLAVYPERIRQLLPEDPQDSVETTEAAFQRMCNDLEHYQNAAYANRFKQTMQALRPSFVRQAMEPHWLHLCKTYYRLLAHKDEYEVARLYTETDFVNDTLAKYGKGARMVFHFAPSWLAGGHQDRPKKRRVKHGGMLALRLLAACRGIRGGWLDPFRYSTEAKNQRLLVGWFESWLEVMQNGQSDLKATLPQLTHTLQLFDKVKGFGLVRLKSFEKYKDELIQATQQQRRPT
ncbi:indolepyruvate ferredoxin oxidoreductase family protein [Limnobacter litoralis]|uniref:Indolepyruvate ferredoxin oxidoreductase n=1 Tax=Limnobacter litoralis TaxID=481366 RepID=A0ABQ5YVQ7_9BURK|nr:indolepyruvate ferredoxin oxidoreductase family protein [Limnobacter litoralis]GLR26869.1 indolepyruvate ferredoxin oxidoreductase [Limnobacter litoralis]